MYHSESNSHVMCGSGGGPTAVGRGAGVGGENMCEDLRPGSGSIGACITSVRSTVTFLTSVLTAYCIRSIQGTICSLHHSVCQIGCESRKVFSLPSEPILNFTPSIS